jgi:hypothetical protein
METRSTPRHLIRDRFPGLEELLFADDVFTEDRNEPHDTERTIRVEDTASGESTLIVEGVYVHSRQDPLREARRLAETFKAEGLLVALGFGLGYAVEAAASGRGKRIIIVERRPAVLRTAFETRDLSRFLSEHQIIFVVGGTGSGVTGALHFFETGSDGKAPLILRNRPLMGLDADWYAGVERYIDIWVSKDAVNAATQQRFGKRWVRNLMRNMSAIRDLPGIKRLAGILAASPSPPIPVFLAAAGPSLDESGPFLTDIARRCVVVAVDTSLNFLLRGGVEPDFVVSVDPQYWNLRHLDRAVSPGTCLIAESAVYPPALRQGFGRTFLCASLFPLGRFIEDRLEDKGRLGAGGSVATTAWDFALSLGASCIWVAGLDLSFPGLRTHFKGAVFEERALSRATRLDPAESWFFRALRDGSPFYAPAASGSVSDTSTTPNPNGPVSDTNTTSNPNGPVFDTSTTPTPDAPAVLTDKRLSLYAAWFENRFRERPDIRTYSLSAGGLAIPGLLTASLEELLRLPERRAEIDRVLQGAFAGIDADFHLPEHATERATKYRSALDALRTGMARLKALADEGARIAGDARQRRLSRHEQVAVMERLGAINQAIDRSDVKGVAGFLVSASPAPGTEPGDFAAYLESSLCLYGSLREAIEEQMIEGQDD